MILFRWCYWKKKKIFCFIRSSKTVTLIDHLHIFTTNHLMECISSCQRHSDFKQDTVLFIWDEPTLTHMIVLFLLLLSPFFRGRHRKLTHMKTWQLFYAGCLSWSNHSATAAHMCGTEGCHLGRLGWGWGWGCVKSSLFPERMTATYVLFNLKVISASTLKCKNTNEVEKCVLTCSTVIMLFQS